LPLKNSNGGRKKTPTKKRTSERIVVNGKSRVVYQGPRGGKYIKSGDHFVRVETK